MRVRPLAIWIIGIILLLAFWPALAAFFDALSLPLPAMRGRMTWIDVMFLIALGLLAIRVLAMRRPVIRRVVRAPREDAP